jgi:DNA-binding MarR family transcriptional regulator
VKTYTERLELENGRGKQVSLRRGDTNSWAPAESGSVEIAPGVFSPAQITVTLFDTPEAPYAVTVSVRPLGGRLEAVDLTVAQIPGGPPVTRAGLARIPITEIVRGCADHLTFAEPLEGNPDAVRVAPAQLTDQELGLLRTGNPDDEALQILARTFRVARAISDKPTQILHEELGVAIATIKRWLSKAVEAGYLTKEERERGKALALASRTLKQVSELVEATRQASRADLPARKKRPTEGRAEAWQTEHGGGSR